MRNTTSTIVMILLIILVSINGLILKKTITPLTYTKETFNHIENFTNTQSAHERYISNLYADINFGEEVTYEDLIKTIKLTEITVEKETIRHMDNYSSTTTKSYIINNITALQINTDYYTHDYEFPSSYRVEVYNPQNKLITTLSESNSYKTLNISNGDYGYYTIKIIPNNCTVSIDLEYELVKSRTIEINDGTYTITNNYPKNEIKRGDK